VNAEDAYLFRHALLRDAAYQLQLPSKRAKLHALAFELIEALHGGRAPEPPPLDAVDPPKFQPHPTDAVAFELAEHARLALAERGATRAALKGMRALYLRRAAEHAERQYRYPSAAEHWLALSEITKGVVQAECQRRCGVALYRVAKLTPARACNKNALRAFRTLGHTRSEGLALTNLSAICKLRGQVKRAELLLRRALVIHEKDGSPIDIASEKSNLANICLETGRLDEAERLFRQALDLLRGQGWPETETVARSGLGNVFMYTGRLSEALEIHRQALAAHRDEGNRRYEAVALGNTATVLSAMGRHAEALKQDEAAVAAANAVGFSAFAGVALCNLGVALVGVGRLKDGQAAYEHALQINCENGNRRLEGIVRGNLGALHRQIGNLELADSLMAKALEIAHAVQDRRSVGIYLCERAFIKIAGRQLEGARRDWRDGMAALKVLKATRELEEKAAIMREACAKAGVPPFDEDVG
jgi:tetratricopeptide (TPR) repeat protein